MTQTQLTYTLQLPYNKGDYAIVKDIKFTFRQSGKGNVFNMTSVSMVKTRDLSENITNGDFYIADNNFAALFKFLLERAGRDKNEDYFETIEDVFGFSMEEMLELLGDEIVFNFRDGKLNGVVKLKDEDAAKEYFENIQKPDGSYNFEGLNFKIKNGMMFVGEEFSVNLYQAKIDPYTFFYTYGDLGRLYGMSDYKGIFADVTLKNKGSGIEGDVILEQEEFRKIMGIIYGKAVQYIF